MAKRYRGKKGTRRRNKATGKNDSSNAKTTLSVLNDEKHRQLRAHVENRKSRLWTHSFAELDALMRQASPAYDKEVMKQRHRRISAVYGKQDVGAIDLYAMYQSIYTSHRKRSYLKGIYLTQEEFERANIISFRQTVPYVNECLNLTIKKIYASQLADKNYCGIYDRILIIKLIAQYAQSIMQHPYALFPDPCEDGSKEQKNLDDIYKLDQSVHEIFLTIKTIADEVIANLAKINSVNSNRTLSSLPKIIYDEISTTLQQLLDYTDTLCKFSYIIHRVSTTSLITPYNPDGDLTYRSQKRLIELDSEAVEYVRQSAYCVYMSRIRHFHSQIEQLFPGIITPKLSKSVLAEHERILASIRNNSCARDDNKHCLELKQFYYDLLEKRDFSNISYRVTDIHDDEQKKYDYRPLLIDESKIKAMRFFCTLSNIPADRLSVKHLANYRCLMNHYLNILHPVSDNFQVKIVLYEAQSYYQQVVARQESNNNKIRLIDECNDAVGKLSLLRVKSVKSSCLNKPKSTRKIGVVNKQKQPKHADDFDWKRLTQQPVLMTEIPKTHDRERINAYFTSHCEIMLKIALKGPYTAPILVRFYEWMFAFAEKLNYINSNYFKLHVLPALEYYKTKGDNAYAKNQHAAPESQKKLQHSLPRQATDYKKLLSNLNQQLPLLMNTDGHGPYALASFSHILAITSDWAYVEQWCCAELLQTMPKFSRILTKIDGLKTRISKALSSFLGESQLYTILVGFVTNRINTLVNHARERQGELEEKAFKVQSRIAQRQHKRRMRRLNDENRLSEREYHEMRHTDHYKRYRSEKAKDERFMYSFLHAYGTFAYFSDLGHELDKYTIASRRDNNYLGGQRNRLDSKHIAYHYVESRTMHQSFCALKNQLELQLKNKTLSIDKKNQFVMSAIRSFFRMKCDRSKSADTQMRSLLKLLQPRDCSVFHCLQHISTDSLLDYVEDAFNTYLSTYRENYQHKRSTQSTVMGSTVYALLNKKFESILTQYKHSQTGRETNKIDIDVFITLSCRHPKDDFPDFLKDDKLLRDNITTIPTFIDGQVKAKDYRYLSTCNRIHYSGLRLNSGIQKDVDANNPVDNTDSEQRCQDHDIDLTILDELTEPKYLSECLVYDPVNKRFFVLASANILDVMRAIVCEQLIVNPKYKKSGNNAERYITKKRAQFKAMKFKSEQCHPVETSQISLMRNSY